MKIIVLGAGLVGGPMARDLAADPDFEVTVADRDEEVLAALQTLAPVSTLGDGDLARPRPGHRPGGGLRHGRGRGARASWASAPSRRSSKPAVPVVDIAFFPEDPFGLDALAREKGVTAMVDCGVFPGMGSALIGRVARQLDRVDRRADLRRRPARGPQLALGIQGRLLARRRDRGVRPPRPLPGERRAGHPARPVRPRADRLRGRRHPRGLQHRRAAHPCRDHRRART